MLLPSKSMAVGENTEVEFNVPGKNKQKHKTKWKFRFGTIFFTDRSVLMVSGGQAQSCCLACKHHGCCLAFCGHEFKHILPCPLKGGNCDPYWPIMNPQAPNIKPLFKRGFWSADIKLGRRWSSEIQKPGNELQREKKMWKRTVEREHDV